MVHDVGRYAFTFTANVYIQDKNGVNLDLLLATTEIKKMHTYNEDPNQFRGIMKLYTAVAFHFAACFLLNDYFPSTSQQLIGSSLDVCGIWIFELLFLNMIERSICDSSKVGQTAEMSLIAVQMSYTPELANCTLSRIAVFRMHEHSKNFISQRRIQLTK